MVIDLSGFSSVPLRPCGKSVCTNVVGFDPGVERWNVPEAGIPQQAARCVFDNFVWFKDEEIVAEIRKDLPSFDGTAPEGGEAVRKVLAVLERLLKSKKLPSRVSYNFSLGSEGQERPEHIFTASNSTVRICKVIFSQPATVPEKELQQAAQALIGNPYSKVEARTPAETGVLQVYRKYGYLRAAAQMPSGMLDPSCTNAAAVTIPIEPGAAYVWDKVTWSGNKVIATQSLDSMLAMQTGEIANGQKIDAGLAAVLRAYWKQGYAGVQMQPSLDYNDAGKRVGLKVVVNEGPQFKMGTLNVLGLSETGVGMFKELWRIKPGEIYDATYLGEFIKKLLDAGGIPADQVGRIKTSVKPDRQKQTIDVVIDFGAKL